jgi:hypothetical protein
MSRNVFQHPVGMSAEGKLSEDGSRRNCRLEDGGSRSRKKPANASLAGVGGGRRDRWARRRRLPDGVFDDADQLFGVEGLAHKCHGVLDRMIAVDPADHDHGRVFQLLVQAQFAVEPGPPLAGI